MNPITSATELGTDLESWIDDALDDLFYETERPAPDAPAFMVAAQTTVLTPLGTVSACLLLADAMAEVAAGETWKRSKCIAWILCRRFGDDVRAVATDEFEEWKAANPRHL